MSRPRGDGWQQSWVVPHCWAAGLGQGKEPGPGKDLPPPYRPAGEPGATGNGFSYCGPERLADSQLGEGRWKLLWNYLFIYTPPCSRKDLKRLRNCFVYKP
jgi:hypothetical protein